MTPSDVLTAIRQSGGEVRLVGERIRYRIPRAAPNPAEILEALRAQKAEIIEALRAQGESRCGSPHCASCYSVGVIDGRERFIHPPKASLQWQEWLRRWEPKGKPQ